MEHRYTPLDLAQFADYNRYWRRCLDYSSDQSFIVIWSWTEYFGYEARWTDDLIWLRQNRPAPCWLPPVGEWRRDDWQRLLLEEVGPRGHFVDVPKGLVQIWQQQLGSKISAQADRDSFEYLYAVEDLATLAGNRHMRRRNKVNQFRRHYDAQYLSMTPEMTLRVVELQKAWLAEQNLHQYPLLEGEHQAILKVLDHWPELGMLGGVIELEGQLIAYTLAEPVGETVMIHYEKALEKYPSAYQVINKDFLFHDGRRFKVANREEDMGDAGLRHAKMAYSPDGFVEKYVVDWNAEG